MAETQSLAQLADAADAAMTSGNIVQQIETVAALVRAARATGQSGDSRDAALGTAAQMALDYIARINGVQVIDDLGLESAFVTLSLMRSLDPYMSGAGKDRNRQIHESICNLYNAGRCIDRPQPTLAAQKLVQSYREKHKRLNLAELYAYADAMAKALEAAPPSPN
ncbi:hypothetical protein [Chromobacterium subtsugae]|uniref:hypothetical protein n=1 Tax=Chromobacterium subtsugae TaxID=251747 RepID=UPI000640D520|nr:hypothetical protein [Chromobacterium subtsugae]